MIAEDYVSFEIAKLLKEKGFNEDTICVYIGMYLLIKGEGTISNATDMPIIAAPTHQMAMKYLREVHNLFIEIQFCQETEGAFNEIRWKSPTYKYKIIAIANNNTISPFFHFVNTDFDTYEEAVEKAIKYCLEKLI